MMGINLESQLMAIKKFIEKNKKKKTVILYPNNNYAKYVEKNLNLVNFKNKKLFKYSKDPKKLTDFDLNSKISLDCGDLIYRVLFSVETGVELKVIGQEPDMPPATDQARPTYDSKVIIEINV